MRTMIQTERLKLRPLALADAPAISKLSSDPAVARNTGNIPVPNPVVAVEGWILINRARAPLGEDYVFGIEQPGQGLVGVVGAHARGQGPFELGYWIGRPFWGRGFATEAACAIVREAPALGPLQASHYVDNPASGRVLQKAGFVYTGGTRKLFSLARGESADARLMELQAQRLAA